MTNEIIATLNQAADGLLFMSESDYPFAAFTWSDIQEPLTIEKLLEVTEHSQEEPVETVDLDYFFRNCAQEKDWHDQHQKENVKKYRHLIEVIKNNLTDINVYRIGTIDIDVYIVGKTPSGNLAGISTKLVET